MAKNDLMNQSPQDWNLDGTSIFRFLTYRIARLHFELNSQAMSVLNEDGKLGLSMWRVLAMVASGNATTSAEIASVMKMDPAIVSRTTHKLEADGLLKTERSAKDRRVIQISITDEGRHIYKQTLPKMRRRQKVLIDALTDDQQDIVFDILDRLEKAAEIREF